MGKKLFPKPGTLYHVRFATESDGGLIYFGPKFSKARPLEEGVYFIFLSHKKQSGSCFSCRTFKFLDENGRVVKRYWFSDDLSREDSFDPYFEEVIL